MATNIDISVKGLGELDKATKEIDKGAKSMNALKTELRQLTQQLQSMDAGSEEFLKLSQKAGDVRDKIKDTSEAINANAGPAFERLGNNASLLTSKLASLDFGGASESVGALAQSVKGVSFKTLGAELGTFTKSLGTLGKALLTNPIFLLAAAIAAIVMNFETLKNVIPGVNEGLTGVTEEMTDALDASKAMTEQSKAQLDYITRNENVLKLQGKTEREILNIKIKATEEGLLALKNQIQAQKVIADAQIKTAARNKEIASGIIQFLTAPLQGILATIDLIGQAVGKDFGLRNKFNEFTSNLLFDPEEAKKKADEEAKVLQEQFETLENQRASFVLSVQAMDKQAAEKGAAAASEARKKQIEEQKKADAVRLKLEQDLQAMIAAQELSKVEATRQAEAQRLQVLTEQKELRAQLTMSEQEAEIAAIDAKYIKLREAAHGDAELNRLLAEQNGAEVDAINAKYAQAEMARQQQLNASKFQMASDVLNGISSLNDLFNSGSEKSAKRAFQINKGIQIAQAIAETYKGANAIFAAAALNPASVLFPAQPFIAAGAAVAAGLANVKRITATKFEGGGGGASGGGGGAAPSFAGGGSGGSTPQFSALNTTFLQGQQNQTPPVQTYVLAGNVESQMQAREKIQDQSTL
jgi:hypothetical protein